MAKKTKKTEKATASNVEAVGDATVENVAKVTAEVEQPKPSTIYIGKTVYGLTYGTVFKGGVLPPHVAELAKKDAAIRGLIIPLTELQTARQNMRVKGHNLNVYANKQK